MKISKNLPLTIAISMVIGSNAYAACDNSSKTVFSCTTTNHKQIEVCDAGQTISYSFGKIGSKPELALSVPRAKASTFQWHGFGRYINYSVTIPNGEYRYNVYTSIDKMEEDEKKGYEAGVTVEKKQSLLATVICRDDTVVDNIQGIDLQPTDI
ncbi:MAG: hypothetical protein ACPGSM_16815 [Thiolinea sp.]